VKIREYIEEKNRIVKEATGLVLVPEDQIVDIPVSAVGEMSVIGDMSCCPYCQVYSCCQECPMGVVGNYCERSNENSTYLHVVRALPLPKGSVRTLTRCLRKELGELVDRYNSELDAEIEREEP
jgi:hypothetical protein